MKLRGMFEGTLNDFKAFIVRGNVLDMAVGVIKECQYCFSTIPIKAIRCAHCTSDVTA